MFRSTTLPVALKQWHSNVACSWSLIEILLNTMNIFFDELEKEKKPNWWASDIPWGDSVQIAKRAGVTRPFMNKWNYDSWTSEKGWINRWTKKFHFSIPCGKLVTFQLKNTGAEVPYLVMYLIVLPETTSHTTHLAFQTSTIAIIVGIEITLRDTKWYSSST